MITQVSGFNPGSVTTNPRQKTKSLSLKSSRNIPHLRAENPRHPNHSYSQKNAFWTSVSVVAGAVLFTMGYFILSSFKNVKA